MTQSVNRVLDRLTDLYRRTLYNMIKYPTKVYVSLFAALMFGFFIYRLLPNEFAPREDRGAFFIIVNGPEGASFDFISKQMLLVEDILMPYVESGEARRALIRAPRGFGGGGDYSGGFAIMTLNDWSERRSAFRILGEVRSKLSKISGVRAIPIMRSGLGGGVGKPVQFVLGGSDFATLAKWRDIVLAKADSNPGLVGIEDDYDATRPQLIVDIDKDRAADLGVSVLTISRTLESMLGSRIVTSYENNGEEYNVIIQGLDEIQRSPNDI
jgi:multidrug efflux pump